MMPVGQPYHHFVFSYWTAPCDGERCGSHFHVIRLGLSFCRPAALVLVFRLHLWFLMCLKDDGV